MPKSVLVIGGGISGLSASVLLAERGYKVTLTEASPKLGGRAYSFFDKNMNTVVDNGQHILASWYHNTFKFLKIIGSFGKITFQKNLDIVFADNQSVKYRLKTSNLPPPLHLAGGIMKFKALDLKDKLSLIRLVNTIKKNRIQAVKLENMNVDELFNSTGQTENAVNFFWKPFIIAVFNAEPENTSAAMFAEIIKIGFIQKGGSELVLPNDFLNKILAEPAESYLHGKNADVILNKKASKINFEDNRITSIIYEDNAEIKTDFYICTAAFYDFIKIGGYNNLYDNTVNPENLKSSPIVNIHLKFESNISNIFTEGFIGLLNTSAQWVFKPAKDQLCVVISSAYKTAEMDKDEILKHTIEELYSCIPELKPVKILSSRVIKEMRATFIPDCSADKNRPGNATKFSNFFIAGDWTDTGLPATIEGAVKSAVNCVELIEKLSE